MTEEQKAQYEKLKAQVNEEELLEKVRLGHVLMEWENARYMELPMAKRKEVEEQWKKRNLYHVKNVENRSTRMK